MTTQPEPAAHPLSCPKCRYKRRESDTAPITLCPACGLVFAKYKPRAARPAHGRSTGQMAQKPRVLKQDDVPSPWRGLLRAIRFWLAAMFLAGALYCTVAGWRYFPAGGGTPGYDVYAGVFLWGLAVIGFFVAALLVFGPGKRSSEVSALDELGRAFKFQMTRVAFAVFGAASILMAARGLKTGKVFLAGRDFVWAAQPLGFSGVVLAMGAFGLLMVWVGWVIRMPTSRE